MSISWEKEARGQRRGGWARGTYSSPGLGGSTWLWASAEDTEKGRADWKVALALEVRLVLRLVEELHDRDWAVSAVVRIVARVVEDSAKRPRRAPVDFRAGIENSLP